MSICSAASSHPATSSSTKWRGGSASTRWPQAARALGLGHADRHRNAGRARRLHPDPRLEAGDAIGVPWQQGETLVTGIGQGYVLATPLQLCTLAARIASGKAVVAAHRPSGRRARSQPRPLPAAAALLRRGIRRGARGHERGGQRAGRHGLCAGASPQPGFEMAGKTGTAQVRVITKEERQQRRDAATRAALESARPWPCSSPSRRSTSRAMPAPVVIEHGGRRASAGADRARHPALRAAARSRWACPPPIPSMPRGAAPLRARAARMTTRPYAAAERTLSIADKLLEDRIGAWCC